MGLSSFLTDWFSAGKPELLLGISRIFYTADGQSS